ncbi:response regulator transcription factor [Pseudonocardia sp. KRD291]|uniref:response regulator transcription factor n=1 Tax=Pseudonocardia sp. KRD291 TaxID=2792007 RepID=UPI001C4A417A|nr:response regulator transcription factor [Pseudonocardia sp. KRD291]MBW0105864.1 response regulator transcription factor [Pseudonocardia sp. KRD291]
MSVTAWETDNHSQFHIRRRACLAGCGAARGQLAVLLVTGPADAQVLARALAGQLLELEHVADPAEALLAIGRTCPDVVILGPNDGSLDPVAFLQVIRTHEPDLPVVVGVTSTEEDLAGPAARLGAAVLAHPFDPDRLLQILRSLVTGRRQIEPRPLLLDLGRLRIDSAAPRIWLDGALIKLPMREHLLLRYLAERRDAVVSRRELITALWGADDARSSNSLAVHILRLRRRLGGDDSQAQWIEAIRGLGYQLSIPPPPLERGLDP